MEPARSHSFVASATNDSRRALVVGVERKLEKTEIRKSETYDTSWFSALAEGSREPGPRHSRLARSARLALARRTDACPLSARTLAPGDARHAFPARSCPFAKKQIRGCRGVSPSDAMGATREASRRAAASLRHAVARARAARAVAGPRGSVPAQARDDALRVANRAPAGPSPLKRHSRLAPPVGARKLAKAPPARGFAVPTVGAPSIRRGFHGSSLPLAAAGDDGAIPDPEAASSVTARTRLAALPPTAPGAAAAVASLSAPQRAALLKALLTADPPRLTKHDTDALFAEADVDGDEALSREEFDRVLVRFGDRGYSRGGADGASGAGDVAMTREQRRALFLSQAIPFVGFGFMDNAIMIIAGEYIEMSIGTMLALSTMAAAGLGNLLSDVAGIGFSSKIESLTESVLKIRPPELSRVAKASFDARLVKMLGAVVGISVGCLLGMFPLLFFDADHDHNLRPDADGDAGDAEKRGENKHETTPRETRA